MDVIRFLITNKHYFIILIFYLLRSKIFKFYYKYFNTKKLLLKIPYFKRKAYKKLYGITKSLEDDFLTKISNEYNI